ASKTTVLLATAENSFVPSAVRNSTVWPWVTKLTGKISGSPAKMVTSRPSATPANRPQLSSSDRKVTGSSVMGSAFFHFQDIGQRPPRRGRRRTLEWGRDPHADHDLWLAPSSDEAPDDVAAFLRLDHVGQRTGRHAVHRALEQDGRQHLAASQHVQPRVLK